VARENARFQWRAKTRDIHRILTYPAPNNEQTNGNDAMKPKTVGRIDGENPVQAQHLIAGVMPGSLVLTLDGEMPVEHLLPGDRIVTRDTGTAVLRAIHRHEAVVRAVCIMAGSLGDTRPDRDVILPEDQQVLVRDWRAKALFGLRQAVVRAGALVDGEFILALGERPMTLFELEFETPHVLYVDGLELAGFDPVAARAA
jgi:hypothetical protein